MLRILYFVMFMGMSQAQGKFSFSIFTSEYPSLFPLDSSITFLPDVPLCVGDTVEMICYVVHPAGTSFIIDSALISLDGSIPVTVGAFNGLTSIDGIDTSRYTADSAGLSISTSRPGVRITISDYQATDGSVVFGCGGLFSNASASDVLISDFPQSLAG